jgi:hypothetical protein
VSHNYALFGHNYILVCHNYVQIVHNYGVNAVFLLFLGFSGRYVEAKSRSSDLPEMQRGRLASDMTKSGDFAEQGAFSSKRT